jgi:RNase P/RNase MRP subunit POP5
LRAGNIYQFKNLSKFKSVEEFNDHKKRFLQHHPDLFTRSEFIAFEVLSQYSIRVPGVANAKIETLVIACAGKQGGVSRATFVRMLRKTKAAGILKVYKTYRSSGGFAHNVFVFQPFDSSHETKLTHREHPETPYESKEDTIKSDPETKNLFLNLKNKDLNIRQENVSSTKQNSSKSPRLQDLDHTFVPESVPQTFVQTVKPFFYRANEIYTFWQKACLAYEKCNFETPIEYLTSVVIEAFKTTAFYYKRKKIKSSFMQYYYGTLSGMFSAEKRREYASKYLEGRYNWLEA